MTHPLAGVLPGTHLEALDLWKVHGVPQDRSTRDVIADSIVLRLYDALLEAWAVLGELIAAAEGEPG